MQIFNVMVYFVPVLMAVATFPGVPQLIQSPVGHIMAQWTTVPAALLLSLASLAYMVRKLSHSKVSGLCLTPCLRCMLLR